MFVAGHDLYLIGEAALLTISVWASKTGRGRAVGQLAGSFLNPNLASPQSSVDGKSLCSPLSPLDGGFLESTENVVVFGPPRIVSSVYVAHGTTSTGEPELAYAVIRL